MNDNDLVVLMADLLERVQKERRTTLGAAAEALQEALETAYEEMEIFEDE